MWTEELLWGQDDPVLCRWVVSEISGIAKKLKTVNVFLLPHYHLSDLTVADFHTCKLDVTAQAPPELLKQSICILKSGV